MTQNRRPLPQLDDTNRFFWTSGADGKLRFQRCEACGHWQHPPSIVCPRCLGRDLVPTPVSGFGTIEALTVNHQPWSPDMVVPYAIAIVGLDEGDGLQLTTNIVGVPPEAAAIGQRVRVAFEAVEDVYLPLFTPV